MQVVGHLEWTNREIISLFAQQQSLPFRTRPAPAFFIFKTINDIAMELPKIFLPKIMQQPEHMEPEA